MKIFKSLFALALMALTINLSAGTNPDAELRFTSKVVDDHALILQLVNLQQNYTHISIESLNGETIFYEENVWKHNGYRVKINLENLADGRYVIQVKQGDITKNQVMLIRNKEIFLSAVSG